MLWRLISTVDFSVHAYNFVLLEIFKVHVMAASVQPLQNDRIVASMLCR